MKGAWWWNEEVKEKVREKKEAHADFMNNGAVGERVVSRARYEATKKAVAVAKSMDYDRLYHRLETKEREKDVFKLARREKEEQGI